MEYIIDDPMTGFSGTDPNGGWGVLLLYDKCFEWFQWFVFLSLGFMPKGRHCLSARDARKIQEDEN